ncbi:MAG: 3'-5' exonuclease [Parasutterella excrementihominis]
MSLLPVWKRICSRTSKQNDKKALQEERRLMYVAITRKKGTLFDAC